MLVDYTSQYDDTSIHVWTAKCENNVGSRIKLAGHPNRKRFPSSKLIRIVTLCHFWQPYPSVTANIIYR